MALIFESKECARCGGTGRHSYNQIDGNRCFGCGGAGEKVTKRGQAAQTYYIDKLVISVNDLEVGMRVIDSGDRYTVASIVIENAHCTKVYSVSNNLYVYSVIESVRRIPTKEERLVLIKDSLAFQSTLTKAGAVSKRSNNKGAK